jgi:tubulin--tyrosine ligase like protein 10
MLVACTKPYLVLTNSGYIRMSLEDYNLDTFGTGDKKDKTTHLTNASVQKGHPKFKELKESTIMSMDQLGEYMIKNKSDIVPTKSDFDTKVVDKISEICRLTFESVKNKLERKFGCFELFGFDFLLDDDLNPVLVEVNTNPAIFTDTEVQKEMLPKLVDDAIKLALQLHPAGKTNGNDEVKAFLENNEVTNLQLPYKIIY